MKCLTIIALWLLMLTPEHLAWLRQDWARFPEHVMGQSLWSGQKDIIRSVQHNPFTAVKAGHKVGKTHTVGSLVPTFLLLNPYSKVITTANTYDQVRGNVWGEIRDQVRASPTDLGGDLLTMSWHMDAAWEAVGLSTNTADSFQGKHAKGGTLVIFDECQAIDLDIWKAAKTMISGPSRFLGIANPTKTSGAFFDYCHDPEVNLITLSCLDHPNIVAGVQVMPGVTPDFVSRYEPGTVEWACRVVGEFPDSDDHSFITLKMLRESTKVEPIPDGTHLGVDIARFGNDENVMLNLTDRVVKSVDSWRGQSTMETTGRIVREIEEHGIPPENVHIDVIGVGGGVVDRLYELGYPVDPVNNSESPKDDWYGILNEHDAFLNRRAELYWVAKELLKQGALCIPAEFRQVHTDLAAPTYSYNSHGKIQIEAKDKIKKRIGRSPDHGDALVMALSREGGLVPSVRHD